MLSGLSQTGEKMNIRGMIQIDYVPTDWVDRASYSEMPDATNYSVEVPLKSGKSWLQVFVLVGERAWSEEMQNTAHGEHYDIGVSAMLPRQDTAIAKELYRTAKYRYLIRLTDLNGEQWTLGTLNMPLSFTSSFNSRQNINFLKFSGQSLRKATGLTYSPLPPPGQVIVDPNGPTTVVDIRYEIMETQTGLSGALYKFTTNLPTGLSWFVLRNKTVHFPTITAGNYLQFTPVLETWEVLELVFLKQD